MRMHILLKNLIISGMTKTHMQIDFNLNAIASDLLKF